MTTPKQETYAVCAAAILKNLEKRGMAGYYCQDSKTCTEQILTMLPKQCSIAFGGSETLKESGILDTLKAGDYRLTDRLSAKTPEEGRQLYAQAVMSDYFFTSSNAITMDGELVNIDGTGNRVACLIHGPEHVFVIIGMNKVSETVQTALSRVRNIASPMNAMRLERQTPCTAIGKCTDCFSPDCICNHTVITRRCTPKGRIRIFLVGEDLGY